VDWYRPKFDNFACANFANLLHISIHPKIGLIAKDDLFGEIWIKSLPTPKSNQRKHGVIYGRLP